MGMLVKIVSVRPSPSAGSNHRSDKSEVSVWGFSGIEAAVFLVASSAIVLSYRARGFRCRRSLCYSEYLPVGVGKQRPTAVDDVGFLDHLARDIVRDLTADGLSHHITPRRRS